MQRSSSGIDFAGSTVVHSIGGWVALAAILIIGPRIGRFGQDGKPIEPHSPPTAVLGMFLLGAVSAIAGINILLATLLYGVKLEELFGVNVGLDDRMATGTSLGFLLLCFRMATWHRNSDFSFVAAIVGVIVSGGLLLLLLADARAFDTLPLFRETSLPTLLFFTLVFTGTLAPGYRD